MTETQQRFLRAIAERVPKEDIVEIHLFPAIRQGGVETGVAVVAERPRTVVPDESSSNGHGPQEADPPAVPDNGLAPTVEFPDATPETTAATVETTDATPETLDATADSTVVDRMMDEADVHVAVEDSERTAGVTPHRLTVHTARYRLTLKGVDRGKWEVDVVAEADAPLAAVDAVVRGVQRRSGEGADPDRLSAEAFRNALEAPLATLER